MSKPKPANPALSISDADLTSVLAQIGAETDHQPLRSSALARIVRETFHGSDAGGAWDWRMVYDLMQAAAIQVVLRGHREANFRLSGYDHERLGIGGVILLALDERASVLWRDQFHHVAKRCHLPRPVMRSAASRKDDQAGILPRHKRGELLSRQLFAKLDLSCPQGTMDLENIFCQIDPDHHILHLAILLVVWLSTPQPSHN